jgi:hypothetical protein
VGKSGRCAPLADAREVGPTNLEGCQVVLARLHALDIVKRQLSWHSFLVRQDGSVLIQGSLLPAPLRMLLVAVRL